MTEFYTWRGGSEMLLRHGSGSTTTVLVLPALFEEANRMRRFTVSVMRALAKLGIGSVLPDLPGTGESLTPLAKVSFTDWQDAIESLTASIRQQEHRCMTVAIRGGALLDLAGDHGWRLAPENGERVLRDLVRATALSSDRSATEIDSAARLGPIALAGHIFSPNLYNDLYLAATPATNRRTARLTEDTGPRDISLDGTRLWRGAEPGDDPDFATATAIDIHVWTVTCASL